MPRRGVTDWIIIREVGTLREVRRIPVKNSSLAKLDKTLLGVDRKLGDGYVATVKYGRRRVAAATGHAAAAVPAPVTVDGEGK